MSNICGENVPANAYLGDLNQTEAARALNDSAVALLPLGAVEVHGDHLPLLTDLYLAQGVCDMVARGLPGALVLPGMPYGQIWSLRDKKGCLGISDATLTALLCELGRSLWKQGVPRFAVINAHVGNVAAIKAAQRVLYDECALRMYSFTYPGVEEAQRRVLETRRPHGAYFHACEIETSYMLYLRPDKVDMSKAICQYPEFPPTFDALPTPWPRIMDTAVMGDATAATAEKGRAMIDAVVSTIIRLLGEDA